MKGKFFVGEFEQDLDDGASQHLVGAHALCSGTLRLDFAGIQILQNMTGDGRALINDVADHLEFLVLGMVFNAM
jgi:hypothetical protein